MSPPLRLPSSFVPLSSTWNFCVLFIVLITNGGAARKRYELSEFSSTKSMVLKIFYILLMVGGDINGVCDDDGLELIHLLLFGRFLLILFHIAVVSLCNMVILNNELEVMSLKISARENILIPHRLV
ncbi:hypothetical protein VNO77_02003 [Canavalia gladiata]|uniref:Transmembrane protein n=1 Tax=Canavalia gladiata TaxID=3824 RepID=A0AAN9MSX9_CANGL